eukprot:gene21342-27651_t
MPLVNEFLNSHEDIEALLESYLMDYNSLESKIESLIVQIQSAEELILLRLDTSRNELMVVQTSMAILSVAIGHTGCVNSVLFSEDGNLIYTGSDDTKINIYDTNTCVLKNRI